MPLGRIGRIVPYRTLGAGAGAGYADQGSYTPYKGKRALSALKREPK